MRKEMKRGEKVGMVGSSQCLGTIDANGQPECVDVG